MGHFLDVAYQVLREGGIPLSPKDIVDIGTTRGLLKTEGKTPAQTMKSKLSTDILWNKEKSAFMRTEEGKFGLREWKNTQIGEFVAARFKKSLMDEDVVVFPASSLHKYLPGVGLHTTPLRNGRELLAECYPMMRSLAEEDFSVIQLVSVFILKFNDKYLTYKRTKRLPESRLHGYYSVAFGGHLNYYETVGLFDIFDPEVGSVLLQRELSEEVKLPQENLVTVRYKGLLYDDSKKLSTQHLGIAYDVILQSSAYEIGERGFLMDPKFETLDEIEGRADDFENWSVLIFQHERGICSEVQRDQK